MTKALAKQDTAIATFNQDDPFLAVATETGNDRGELLKFVKGEWKIGNDIVPQGTEFVAHISQLVRGWVHFEDGKVVDEKLGKVADNFKPPLRQDLPDNIPANWKKDDDGESRDPWVHQWYLPLIDVNAGNLVTFVTGSGGGDDAVGRLCNIYGLKRGLGVLPIVALKTGSYKHKKYGTIPTPELLIVGWDGTPMAPAPVIQKMTDDEEPPPVTSDQEFEDEIP
jgi:hypothetical protein